MYCGTCIHDNTLAAAMLKKKHEVALIPTYTPIRTDETDVSLPQIFYGGINVFLEQKFPLFRRTHGKFEKVLDSPRLLNWLARFSSSTNARELGALAVSVLQGEDGFQKKELEKLISWLRDSYRPQIVNLTNSMFAGFARQMKRELKVPVLCSLQGEDLFFEDLVEPYKPQTLSLLREKCKDIDGFITGSNYYREYMSGLLQIPPERVHVVRLGINMNGYGESKTELPNEPFVIGYLARICPEKGLHLLTEAFYQLTKQFGREKLFLKVAGYLGKKDQPYFDGIVAKIKKQGLADRVSFVGEVDRKQKIDFLQSIHVLSVPAVYRESKGLYVLEALASKVPVVEPRHGAFPELIEHTHGGILVDPNSAEALAVGLARLMQDLDQRKRLGVEGRRVVERCYTDDLAAEETVKVYSHYL